MTLPYLLQSTVAVVFTLGLVILLHEWGHFIVCRLLGVRVERFAFGFGPELFGVTRKGTRYSLCAFPLGGFVKPAGESLEEFGGKPDEYFAQSWYRRLAIVYAGPSMNYLLAFVLFTGVVWIKGVPESGKDPVIGNLMTGFPADAAGLKIDDRVVSVNGKAISTWEELAGSVHASPGKAVSLVIRRGEGESLTKSVVPRKDDATGRGLIGIMAKPFHRPVAFVEAASEGGRQCVLLTMFTIKTLASKIYKRERPDVAGPVGIVQMVSRAAHSGLEDLIFLIGLISVAIGFFNFLPVPLLDGGHAALYIWEGISGKKLTQNAMATANSVGIVFLLSLLVFATYNDFSRILGERSARKKAAAEIGDMKAPEAKPGKAAAAP